jgi:hypothetical protein
MGLPLMTVRFDALFSRFLGATVAGPSRAIVGEEKMSGLAGDKLIAIVPVLGWWDQRRTLKTQELRFSLVV